MIEPTPPSDETVRLKCLHSLKVLDTSPEERFDRITRLARQLFDVPISLVSLVDSDRQWFKSRAGLDAIETPRSVSFCGHAINGSEVFVVENALCDERFCDNPLVADDPSIRFYAGYPLHSPDGARLGTLCIIDRQPREFSAEEARTLKELGEMVEAELFSVTSLSTDRLTGLTNRRGFYAIAPYALALCRRQREPATLAMMDVDGLRRVNDLAGRDAGDELLGEFARYLIKSCRESDVVARLDGGGFCVLMPGMDERDALAAIRRLRHAVEAANRQRDPAIAIRFSVGCIAVDTESEPSLDSLLRQADVAMCQQKAPEHRPAVG